MQMLVLGFKTSRFLDQKEFTLNQVVIDFTLLKDVHGKSKSPAGTLAIITVIIFFSFFVWIQMFRSTLFPRNAWIFRLICLLRPYFTSQNENINDITRLLCYSLLCGWVLFVLSFKVSFVKRFALSPSVILYGEHRWKSLFLILTIFLQSTGHWVVGKMHKMVVDQENRMKKKQSRLSLGKLSIRTKVKINQ